MIFREAVVGHRSREDDNLGRRRVASSRQLAHDDDRQSSNRLLLLSNWSHMGKADSEREGIDCEYVYARRAPSASACRGYRLVATVAHTFVIRVSCSLRKVDRSFDVQHCNL